MRVAVLLDLYEPMHHTKDGNILLGLAEMGAEPRLVTAEKPALVGYAPSFPVIQAPQEAFRRSSFWEGVEADLVLAYTWLNRHRNPEVRAIKRAGKPLLIRADRDGRIGSPLLPREYYLYPARTISGIRNLMRRAAWQAFSRLLRAAVLQQFLLADAIYIESEEARGNLNHILAEWGRSDLADKIHHLPVAISDTCLSTRIREKRSRVVAVGRWEDRWVKNTETAVKVLVRLLERRPDCRVVMLGSGQEIVKKILGRLRSPHANRFSILGHRPQEELAQILGESRVLFLPSRTEAFPLSAGDAVCMGCTVVGAGLEAIIALSKDGLCGTVADGYRQESLLQALTEELNHWDSGRRDPEAIATLWRSQLDRRNVARKILHLGDRLVNPGSEPRRERT